MLNTCLTRLSSLVLDTRHINIRSISTSVKLLRDVEDRRLMLRSLPTKDEGTAGEKSVDIDSLMNQ